MKKLLIIDDEAGLRSLLESIFNDEYSVYLAEDGETAIEIVKNTNIDLAILDMRLKNVDGLKVLQEIRKHDNEVRVFILTAYIDTKKSDELFQLGIEEILQKPFDIFELKRKVNELLS